MPVLMSHFVMLQRNLIYTGITRAKKILVLVGTRKALAYGVRHVTVTKRNSMLKERLTGDWACKEIRYGQKEAHEDGRGEKMRERMHDRAEEGRP